MVENYRLRVYMSDYHSGSKIVSNPAVIHVKKIQKMNRDKLVKNKV